MKKLSELIKGKGMLVGFLVFLMAVGIGSFAVYKSTMNKLTNGNVLTKIEGSQVANSVSDVKKTTASPSEEKTTVKVDLPNDGSESKREIDTETQPFVMPVKGDIINPFSNGELVKSETLGYWQTHDGVDIKAKAGTKVVAMTNGTVTKVIEDPLFGTVIIINHGNNIEGHYYNLKKIC